MIKKQQSWPLSLCLFLLAISIIIGCHLDLVGRTLSIWWNDDSQNQNLLIPIIVLYLLYRKRLEIAQIQPSASWLWSLIILPLSGTLLLADLMSLQSIEITALLILLPITAVAILGTHFAKIAWFPLCYLLLASPFWDYLTPLLQWLAIKASVPLLQLIGIPVFPEGRFINIPSGVFEIEEGCSGIRYMKSALAVGSLYIYLFPGKLLQKFWVFVLIVGFALVGNWIRIVTVILVGYYTDMQHSLVHSHANFGWWVFAGLLIVWFWVSNKILRPDAEDPLAKRLPSIVFPKFNAPKTGVITLLLVIFIATPPLLKRLYLKSPDRWDAFTFQPPEGQMGWSGPVLANENEWQSWFPGAELEIKAIYNKGNKRVLLYTGIYQGQVQGEELVNETNSVFNPAKWATITQKSAPAPASVADQGEITVSVLGLGEKLLVWSWYDFGDKITGKPIVAKVFDVWSGLRGDNGTAIVAIATDLVDSEEDAAMVLEDFMRSHANLRKELADVLQVPIQSP